MAIDDGSLTNTDFRLDPQKQGPLRGVVVLELGSLLAGPFCAQLLSDLGAAVIKVEPPQGDVMRAMGRGKLNGRGLWWPHLARGKKCITLDLRLPEGQDLAYALAQKVDVVVENFRPTTLEKWNLGYDRLSQENAGLILTRVSGFGQTGPYSQRPGLGAIGEAFGGLRGIVGFPDRPPPRVGISIGDSLGGLFGAIGTLAALHERSSSGRGQVVDVALYEAVAAVMESTLADCSRLGIVREPTGHHLPGFAPSSLYTSNDGCWILIAANANTLFRRLCAAMGEEELAGDPAYATDEARWEHVDELDARIQRWTERLAAKEIEAVLEEYEVPAFRVFDAKMILEDAHYRARNAIRWVEDEALGRFAMPGVVPHLSRTPGEFGWSGTGEIGQDNFEVFGRLLQLSHEEIDAHPAISRRAGQVQRAR